VIDYDAYIRDALPAAYDIGLKPWEFDRITPDEFMDLIKAHRRRDEREWYRVATLAYWLVIPHIQKKKDRSKFTPEKLLGLPPRKKPKRIRLVVGQTGEVPSSES
jgi:hypothetical protein